MKRIIFFIIITLLLANYIGNVFVPKREEHNSKQYYKENVVDVLFLGNSHMSYSMSPMEIWHKYGIITYNRGSSGQYYILTLSLLEQTLKEKKPKLTIIDLNPGIFNLTQSITDMTILNQKSIIDRFNSISNVYNKEALGIKIDTMNLINRFHDRWKELNKYDFITESYWKGRWLGSYHEGVWNKPHLVNPVQPNNIVINNNDINNYDHKDILISYIKQVRKISQKYNSNVIFINMPYKQNANSIIFNTIAEEYCKQENIIYIDYNKLYNEINFDFNRDMRENSHLNLYGARKVMDHLIPYIIEHYNIPIKKNDPAYASWNEDYIKYARAINREEIRELKSFNEWKKQAFYDNYTLLLSLNGDVLNNMPEQLKNDLKFFGLKKYNTDKPNMRYAAIIDNNQVFFEEVSNKPVTYKGRMKNIVNLLVTSDGKATINVSGKPRSKNKYGLNFVIYDKVNREIVDSIWIDPRKPDVVRR